jgi:hypothetical protein
MPRTVPGDGGAITEPPAGDLPADDGTTVEPLTGGVESIITGVARQIGSTVKPAAAAAVAVTFGFPLALMIAVVLFLLGQSRLDGRDPKLRAAPLTAAETLLVFRDEDSL